MCFFKGIINKQIINKQMHDISLHCFADKVKDKHITSSKLTLQRDEKSFPVNKTHVQRKIIFLWKLCGVVFFVSPSRGCSFGISDSLHAQVF